MTTDITPEVFRLDTENPNHEEEEDEEEHLRRQEEIKNLLTVAMGDFNYDESTLNSLNCSVDNIEESHVKLQEKYKDSSYNDTLKALYEARTKEVERLSKKLEDTEKTKNKIDKDKSREITCLTAELEQAKYSLRESNNFNVIKTEEVNKLSEEKELLLKKIKELEHELQEISEDRDALHVVNNNLYQQVHLLEKGFLPSQEVDNSKEEEFKNKIQDLTELIEKLEMIIKKQDHEFSNQKQMFERLLQEKDDISKENVNEINKYCLELHRKEMECVSLNAEIQKLNRDKETLKHTLQRTKTNELYNLSVNNLNDQVKKLTEENQDMRTKMQKQLQDLQKLEKIKEEYEEAKSKEKRNIQKINKSMQATDISATNKIDVGLQINQSENLDANVLIKIKELEEENEFLRTKDSQRQEQEILLNDLQKVAQEFEKIIKEKKSKTYKSTTTNTEIDLIETIEVHYQTEIVKLETELREKIKEEFNKKLEQKEKFVNHQLQEIQKASSTASEKQIKKLIQKITDDREATVQLLHDLRNKYLHLEKEIETYKSKYFANETENQKLKQYLIKLKTDYKHELQIELEHYENYKLRVNQKEHKLNTKVNRIINSTQMYNNKIKALEEKNTQVGT